MDGLTLSLLSVQVIILGGVREMETEFNFDFEKEKEVYCPGCGRSLFYSDLSESRLSMKCKCGKPLSIRVNDGVVLIAAKMKPPSDQQKQMGRRSSAYQKAINAST